MVNIIKINLFGTFLFFVYGVILFYFGSSIDNENNWMVDRGFWPKWLGFLIIIISIIIGFQTLGQKNYNIKLKLSINTYLIVAFTAAAFYLFNFFGYFLTSILWMFGVGFFSGEKSFKKLLIFSMLVVFTGYLVFWQILSVQLPLGSIEKYIKFDFFLYG